MSEKEALARHYAATSDDSSSQTSSAPPPAPPTYSTATAAASASSYSFDPTITITAPPIPRPYSHIPLSRYHIPDSKVSPDKTTTTIYSAELTSSPAALEAFLLEQMALPPRPTVRIIARVPNHPIPLFDVQLDLWSHVAGVGGEPSGEECGKWATTKVKGMGEAGAGASGSGSGGFAGFGGLRLGGRGGDGAAEPLRMDEKAALFDGRPDPTGAGFWIRRFCADGGYAKKLILKRQVTNWDTTHLQSTLRSLLNSTGYRGPPLEITFPIQHSTLIIHSPHKHASVLTSLSSLFGASKSYDPLETLWPYASAPRSGDEMLDRKQRECIRQSEDEWVREWRGAILAAVGERRRGWVGEIDKVDAVLAGPVAGLDAAVEETGKWGERIGKAQGGV